MRHRKTRSLQNRNTSWRRATLKSLARNLLLHQRIKTTVQKAKAARPLIERLISLAKENVLSGKREAFSILGDHALVHLLFTEIGPRFSKRVGGYTRIIRLGLRRGDSASLALLELTEIKKVEKKHKKIKVEKAQDEKKTEEAKEKVVEEKKLKADVAVKEKPPLTKKPQKKFLGGLRNIFKKERDAL